MRTTGVCGGELPFGTPGALSRAALAAGGSGRGALTSRAPLAGSIAVAAQGPADPPASGKVMPSEMDSVRLGTAVAASVTTLRTPKS